MQLDPSRTIDRRKPLEKATRKELEKFAKARGVKEVVPGMPAPLMRQILEVKGHTDIHNVFPRIKHRHLGQMNGANSANEQSRASKEQISAIEALTRDWMAQQGVQGSPEAVRQPAVQNGNDGSIPSTSTKSFAKMRMHELRSICKTHGVAVGRSDKKADLIARLEDGQDTT